MIGLDRAPSPDGAPLAAHSPGGSGICPVGLDDVFASPGLPMPGARAAGTAGVGEAQPGINFTIYGEPASKANSRQIVTIGGRPSSIKSKKARDYERDAIRQIPSRVRLRLDGPVRVTLCIFYATERPDLDESVVLDVLQDRYSPAKKDRVTGEVYAERALVQGGVYRNDRQVREKHVYHFIDRANPRAEITVEPLQAQQASFL